MALSIPVEYLYTYINDDNMGKCTTEKFIEKARKKYGDKYDYSKVEYKGYNVKVCIICPIHGEFWITPDVFLHKNGCPKCGLEKMRKSLTKTTEQFIEEAKKIHGDKYDYSKVNYIDGHTKVCIICPKHGEFWQDACKHVSNKKSGCPKCAIERQRLTTEEFIKRAREVHGNKYNYSKTEYVNQTTKVCIICPKHGEFWQAPNGHLEGKGCKHCGHNTKLTTEEFIKRAKEVHGDKYDYSKVIYNGMEKSVCIICPKHGEFWQTPRHHILGFKCGCSKCCVSKLEQFVMDTLNNKKIEFIYECGKKDLSWLGRQRLDIYIPQMKLCVECQGIQHFKPESFGGKKDKDENLKNNIKNDIKKFNKCVENGVKTIYVVDDKKDVIDNVIYKYGNVYDKNEFIKLFENETQSFISLSI